MGRLVEALNACWLPHVVARAGDGAGVSTVTPITLADFKRDIRERHVWCSSCMIAFEGAEPIGVLIGAKRASETLVDRIAIRPDRIRQGHGRHLIESLGAKLTILGPKHMVAEIPDDNPEAGAFFEGCGFAREDDLTDWVLDDAGILLAAGYATTGGVDETFPVPVTVGDLVANRLLADPPGVAWDRATATLVARAETLHGIGLATVDRIEAFVLYRPTAGGGPGAVIDVLGTAPGGGPAETNPDRLRAVHRLLALVLERVGPPLRFQRVAADELPVAWTRSLGLGAAAGWHRFTATARAG
jgi:GNAT superfamily N-acetyltransferase